MTVRVGRDGLREFVTEVFIRCGLDAPAAAIVTGGRGHVRILRPLLQAAVSTGQT